MLLCGDSFGVRVAVIPSIIGTSEIPKIPDFADQTIEYTLCKNGKRYAIPMLGENAIDASID